MEIAKRDNNTGVQNFNFGSTWRGEICRQYQVQLSGFMKISTPLLTLKGYLTDPNTEGVEASNSVKFGRLVCLALTVLPR